MGLGCPKFFLGEFETFLKNKKKFQIFFTMTWAFFASVLKFFASKRAQNGQIWAKSGVWKTLKNPNFEEISVFEGCDGSRMPKMHSWEV